MWMLVSEASEKGPLYRILQESAASGTLDLATQLSYLRGIVGGMHYLADFGYIHKVRITTHAVSFCSMLSKALLNVKAAL